MTADPPDPASRLAAYLDLGDTRRSLPGVTVRDAATMMVIDRAGATPTVLLGRRHHAHKFMPGKYVFPGGRVEAADRRAAAAGRLDSRVEARLMQAVRRPSAEKARGFALAAVREVFEETGVALGARVGAVPAATPPGPGLPQADGAAVEWARFAATGVVPDLSKLHFIARAITPPGRPRRFDTRFFAIDAAAIAARIEGVVGPDTELVELVWMPLDATSQLDIAPITLAVLEELRIRTAAGFGPDVPVPFYREHRGKRLRTLIP
jgi:8-oxo-dGTP pyrophosphatase MutT (NUDIX family)